MFKNPFQTNRSNQQRNQNASLRFAKAKTEEKETKVGALLSNNNTTKQSVLATPEEVSRQPAVFYDQPQAASLLQHLTLLNQDSRSRSTFGPKSSLQKSSFKGMPSSVTTSKE